MCRPPMFICSPGLAGRTGVGKCTPVPAAHTMPSCVCVSAERALVNLRRSLLSSPECCVVAQLVSIIEGYTPGTLGDSLVLHQVGSFLWSVELQLQRLHAGLHSSPFPPALLIPNTICSC